MSSFQWTIRADLHFTVCRLSPLWWPYGIDLAPCGCGLCSRRFRRSWRYLQEWRRMEMQRISKIRTGIFFLLFIFFWMITCLNFLTAFHSLHADPEDGGRIIFWNGGKHSPFVNDDSNRSAWAEIQSGVTVLRGNVVEILTGQRIS